jgi:UDP-N-acetylglucosamine--N-acetylmuramyl-(pentapeptide) pyrophosphoryl-undecaprenol N-acetylglucosamine transferase
VIAVAEAVRRRLPQAEFLYVGTTSGPEAALVRQAALPYQAVHTGRLRRYRTWRNLTDPFLVMAGLAQSMQIARRFRPDVSFAAGGFAAVPPLAGGRALGVPMVIHQQDVIPGLANRILHPVARRTTVAFAETAAALRSKKTAVVGNPTRRFLLAGDADRARTVFGLEPDCPIVLITGGGTGALGLNRIAQAAARQLIARCQIVHLTGVGKAIAGWEHPRYHPIEFVTDAMADVLVAADVVVSRAGMSALSEIAALRKASIVVPMPGSHQEANAAVIRRRGAGVVIHESELSPERLTEAVGELLADPDRAAALGSAAAELLPADADEKIAALLVDLSGAMRGSVGPGR